MHSFVAVTDYPAQCPVEIVLIMYIAKAVYENKIRKAVDFNFASQPRYILILFLGTLRLPASVLGLCMLN